MSLPSIGQLIDDAWDLYRARFNELMNISGWLLLLAILFTLSLALYPSASNLWFSNELSWGENAGVLLFMLTNWIVAPLLGVCVLIGLTRASRTILSGRAPQEEPLYKTVRPSFLPVLLVLIMVALLPVLAVLIGFGPSIILAALGMLFKSSLLVVLANALLLIGIFVALVLAFIWTVEYILSPYATILDNLRGKKALLHSRALVRGRFWEVLLRLLVPKLVFLVVGIILMAIAAYIVGIVVSAASGLNLDLRLRLLTIIQWAVPVVVAVLINPLFVLIDVQLYKALCANPTYAKRP